jgi:hypothetical protein
MTPTPTCPLFPSTRKFSFRQGRNFHPRDCYDIGHAVAQAVSRWLPTAAGSRPGSMWGLWWTKRHWGRFSPSTSISPAIHSTNLSIIIITRGWHNRPIGGRSAEWTQLDSTPHYTNLIFFAMTFQDCAAGTTADCIYMRQLTHLRQQGKQMQCQGEEHSKSVQQCNEPGLLSP